MERLDGGFLESSTVGDLKAGAGERNEHLWTGSVPI